MTDTIKPVGKKISIIAPFFNEEESLPIFYDELTNIINRISDYNFEIIFVDDGSTDNSLKFLLSLVKDRKNIVILELSRNFGKDAAQTAGIDYATGEAVIPIDVDLQDPPSLIEEMISRWENGAEIVLARRGDRKNDSFLKRLTANLFYKLYAFLVGNSKNSNLADFRLFDRKVVESIKNLKEKNRYMKGLFTWPGFLTQEILYSRKKRIAGKSKFSYLKLLSIGFEGITSFSTLPLRFFTIIGFIGIVFSIFFSIVILYQKIYYADFIQGYAFMALLILSFGSLQLLGIGILGEYISKIYLETKNRPIYIIKNRYN